MAARLTTMLAAVRGVTGYDCPNLKCKIFCHDLDLIYINCGNTVRAASIVCHRYLIVIRNTHCNRSFCIFLYLSRKPSN